MRMRGQNDESATSTTHGLQFTYEKRKVKRKPSFKAGWQKSENSYTVPFYNGYLYLDSSNDSQAGV